MITIKEIENLANLARIKIDDSEKEGLTKEIDSILAYVDQIKKATVNIDIKPELGSVNNIMRDDISRDISDEDRKGIINEAPYKEGEFIAVKKIIEQD